MYDFWKPPLQKAVEEQRAARYNKHSAAARQRRGSAAFLQQFFDK